MMLRGAGRPITALQRYMRNASRSAFRAHQHAHRYSTATASVDVLEKASEYRQGQQIHGYTVQKVASVPELSLTAVKLCHNNTGAEHLHVAREDSNNVFGVAFRTTPMDSTGVPHILEHTVLCGSDKYPVRDPFFKMLTRSLSTFMNAFTASDWTMYPFSSQNAQDYQNLMSVYLDAVFFPRLRELDFKQEGWRLENEDVNDPNSPITFKGVVFNEMKGVFSVSQHLFAQKVQNLLMPGHTYSVVYGGDPIHIPDLTWQQLRDFHASHYHPSNSRFYTYGDLPLEDHLQFISENALSKFEKIDPNTQVPKETRWQTPRVAEITCSPDPMVPDPAKQTTVAVSYLLQDLTDTFEAYTMSLVGALLTHGEKSPFYRALLEANIGSDFSPVIGYNGYTKEATFSVGLQGISKDDVDKVTGIINETIDKVIEEGFEDERIEAMLHMIELDQKHQTEKFGLYLGVGLAPAWIHDADPIEALQVNKQVEKFRECVESVPNFLQDKVKQYFKDNQHRLTLVMSPDEEFEGRRQKEEKDKLEKIVSELSEAQRQEVFTQGQELLQKQMMEENLSCLPTLTVADIKTTSPTTETTSHYAKGIPIQLCSQPTNGVTYFHALSSMADLPAHLKPYTSLFCDVATKMGAGVLDYRELSQQVELKTGGLNMDTFIGDHHSHQHSFEQSIHFHSMCLDANIDAMFDLWTEIFHRLNLADTQRLMTLVRMSAAECANSVADKGHSYAMGQSASSLSASGALRELTGGLQQVSLMKTIAEMQDLQPIVDILRDIAHHMLTRQNLRCALNATPETMEQAVRAAEAFVNGLPHPLDSKPEKIKPVEFYHKDPQFHSKSCQTHYELPFQVNYASRSVATVPYSHPDYAREKGGAYGGGATVSSGVLSFYSYRDPNSMQTLEKFDSSVEWASEGTYNQQDIDEAKLSVFAQVDMPITPGNRGMRLFKHGVDDETFQQHRKALFAVEKDDLIKVAQKYLSPDSRFSSVALLGPENTATQNSDWTIKKQS